MDLISSIGTAFALGAGAAAKGIGSEVLTSAYAMLKNAVVGSKPEIKDSIELLENDPASAARRALLEEELTKAGIEDEAVVQAAQKVLDVVTALDQEAAEVVGVSINDVRGASLNIAGVIAEGGGVQVSGSDFTGDISIENVRAGRIADDATTTPKDKR